MVGFTAGVGAGVGVATGLPPDVGWGVGLDAVVGAGVPSCADDGWQLEYHSDVTLQ